jgi:hypothetical protein
MYLMEHGGQEHFITDILPQDSRKGKHRSIENNNNSEN